ncbi:hypothetical protein Glove_25g31 [Diversispora epigaea]|uniref:non-specific serine/threonine protein kinase n=1 Tax=Diversispora epigaea TaxID=1348612 RepID=A0A397JLP9_9GLOM|nr:hypothetical protein Glove_25g31 [Diversispora epigaea]
MSNNIPLPSVEEVKSWSPKEVITFLEIKKDELFLRDIHIKVIEDQKVTGRAFLELNADKLMQDGLNRGPAKIIAGLVKEIKNEGQENLKRLFDEFEEELNNIRNTFREEIAEIKNKLDKLNEMSREIKKIRLFNEVAWFSAPGSVTVTEKGNFVRLQGVCIDFPLKLTITTQRKEYGMFTDPPSPKVSVNILQEYFINECKQLQRSKNSKLVVEDVYSIPLLATRNPDFVFIAKGCPLDALHVVAVGEIKKQVNNKFSNADVGQAVSFGEKVLQLQPWRSYVYVVLTDCKLIVIYKVTRCNFNNEGTRFSYEYVLPANLNYESKDCPPNGWKYLVTIMECDQEKLGWVDPLLKFDSDTVRLVRSISAGRTSIVYEGKLNETNTVVVKLAKDEKYLSCFEREKSVLENLNTSPHIPKLLLYNKNSLVTIPLGTKVENLQKNDIKNIIETLKTAHLQNIVHMDLRKYNFIRNNDKILIIDWGYSVSKNDVGKFSGALECMPDDILKSLANGEQITYSPSIDLICLVRSFYLMLHNPTNSEMMKISFDGISDFKSRVKCLLDFWSSHGTSDLWQKIYKEANDLNYDNLIKELEELF